MEYNNHAGKTHILHTRKDVCHDIQGVQKEKIDIGARSGVRFAESGSNREDRGYIFYWNRKLQQKEVNLLFFAVKKGLLPSMFEDLKKVSDRFITLRFLLVDWRYCSLIAAYALVLTNSPEKINSFFDQFDHIHCTILNADKNCYYWRL